MHGEGDGIVRFGWGVCSSFQAVLAGWSRRSDAIASRPLTFLSKWHFKFEPAVHFEEAFSHKNVR